MVPFASTAFHKFVANFFFKKRQETTLESQSGVPRIMVTLFNDSVGNLLL